MGRDMPPKCLFSLGDSNPPPNTRFLGPTRVHIPDGISIGSAVLARLMIVTHRHTDTQTRNIDNNAVSLQSVHAMRFYHAPMQCASSMQRRPTDNRWNLTLRCSQWISRYCDYKPRYLVKFLKCQKFIRHFARNRPNYILFYVISQLISLTF